MVKVLFVTTRLPYPEDDGRRRLLFNYCRLLHELGHEVGIVTQSDTSNSHSTSAPDFLAFVKMCEPQHPLSSLLKAAFSLTDSSIPLQVAMGRSNKVQRVIDEVIENWAPDVVICDMVRTTVFLEKWVDKCPIIANLDDLLSIRYGRQSEVSSIRLAWSGKRFGWLLKFPLAQHIFRTILRVEANRLSRYEIHVARRFAHTVLVSEIETNILRRLSCSDQVSCWPMGFDITNSLDMAPMQDKVVFVGAMSVPHNIAAVMFFVESILPLVKQQVPGVKFEVVGKDPPASITNIEEVHFTGYVPNVSVRLRQAKIVVAPLVFGSGIKTKVLEAVANQRPVVATSVAAEGLDFISGQDIMISDDPEEFAKYVVRLLKDPVFGTKLSVSAANKLVRTHSWELTKTLIDRVIRDCLGPAYEREGINVENRIYS